MNAMILPLVSLTPAMPHPTPRAPAEITAVESVLLDIGATQHVQVSEWAIDAYLYRDHHWEQDHASGQAAIRALVLRLYQHRPEQVWWTVEYPARSPNEWTMSFPAMRPRCLAVLGDASLPAQAQGLGVMDHLIGWSERS